MYVKPTQTSVFFVSEPLFSRSFASGIAAKMATPTWACNMETNAIVGVWGTKKSTCNTDLEIATSSAPATTASIAVRSAPSLLPQSICRNAVLLCRSANGLNLQVLFASKGNQLCNVFASVTLLQDNITVGAFTGKVVLRRDERRLHDIKDAETILGANAETTTT